MNSATFIPTLGTSDVTAFALRANGEDLPKRLEILSILLCREVNRIPSVKMLLLDGRPSEQDFEVSNEKWFVPGNEIEIFLENRQDKTLFFKGIVVKHQICIRNGSSHLEIDCRDAAYRMTLSRKSRYFEQIDDSELAAQLLDEHGLPHEIAPVNFTHPELVQYDVTDWDFLMMRLEFNGLLTVIDNGKVKIQAPDFNQEATLNLEYGSNVLEFDGELEVRDQFEGVEVRSWNYSDQSVLGIQAKEPAIVPNGNLLATKIAPANKAGINIHRHGGRVVVGELEAWADARLLKDRLSRTHGRVRFRGYHHILPGTIVGLNGFGDRFNGPVYVAGVRQEFFEGGWLTDLEFGLSPKWFAQSIKVEAPAAAGMLASVYGLQIGMVTQIENDPDGEHRIQVRLPIVNPNAAGIWARVATLDAGDGRGTFFLPEPNDEVIVGFINDDPRDAVVLGMLHSRSKAAPIQASKENTEKGYISRAGLKLIFQEEAVSITLETPGGNLLRISDEEQGMLLSDQHGNSIQLGSQGISLNAKGKIQLKASSVTEIKGNPVNIN